MEGINTIIDIWNILKSRGEKLQPLETVQINKIEKSYNIFLPPVYRQFLRIMGNGAGAYMKGSSVFYDEIFSLRQWANELILDNELDPLPMDSFVFWMHQGYQVAYFKLNEGDDPKVFFLSESEGSKQFELIEKSLTDFF
jgi:hypothetical protein